MKSRITAICNRLFIKKEGIADMMGLSYQAFNRRVKENNFNKLEIAVIEKLEKFEWNQVL